MARSSLAKVARLASLRPQTARAVPVLAAFGPAKPICALQFSIRTPQSVPTPRFISTSADRKGITPDNEPPKPKDVDTPEPVRTPAEITEAEYHTVADAFMERLLNHLEELEESNEEIEVEYSVSVLDLTPCSIPS